MLKVDLSRMRGDGFDRKLDEEQIGLIREDLRDIQGRLDEEFQSLSRMQDIRRCRWLGQSADGRKRAEALGKEPFPFEGASDSRIPLADTIVGEHVVEYVTAATRAIPMVKGMEKDDFRRANKMATVLRYVVRNLWGREFRRQLEIAGNYMEGDDPAGCLMHVFWYRERGLRYERVTAYDVLGILVEMLGEGLDEGALEDLFDVVENPDRADDFLEVIGMIHPHLKKRRLDRIVKDFYETGEAEFPVPYVRFNEPRLRTLRLNVNVFVPSNVRDLQRSRVYVVDHYTKAEVLERAGSEGWSKAFVEELIGDDNQEGLRGRSVFFNHAEVLGDNQMKDMYEVVRLYQYAANDDGIPGVYRVTFSGLGTRAAKEMELLRDKHGLMPFVEFMREHLSENLLDSRPVPALVGTQQNSLKLLTDSYEDHVQKSINPPILAPKGSPRFKMQLAPHGQLEVTGRTSPEYLKGPEYPRAADTHERNVRRLVNDAFKRFDADLDPDMVIGARQARVDNFLASLADAMKMVLQLCMQYMTDEQVQRIVGSDGVQVARSVEEIQGVFDFELSFDVRDMDLDFIIKKATVARDYVAPLDGRATVKQHIIAQRILQSVDPHWADGAVDEVDAADERETRETLAEFSQWLQGVETPLKEGGVNAALRLQVIEQEIQKRQQQPDMFGQVSPAAGMIIENMMKNLQFLVQQQQNAVTGKFGTEEVFS